MRNSEQVTEVHLNLSSILIILNIGIIDFPCKSILSLLSINSFKKISAFMNRIFIFLIRTLLPTFKITLKNIIEIITHASSIFSVGSHFLILYKMCFK